jgi:hypothetical protein
LLLDSNLRKRRLIGGVGVKEIFHFSFFIADRDRYPTTPM